MTDEDREGRAASACSLHGPHHVVRPPRQLEQRDPDPHQRKSEARHSHTRDLSADVKLLPFTHDDVGFLFRKLLCWPMRQRSPCSGSIGQGFVPFHR